VRSSATEYTGGGTMSRYLLPALLLTLFVVCTKNPSGPDPSADLPVIYLRDGKTPAADATVSLFVTGSENTRPATELTTDANGRFRLDSIPEGKYDFWAERDSFVLFQGGVIVAAKYTTFHDDTLEPAASLSGIVALQYPQDLVSITIGLKGTDKSYTPSEETGRFTLTGLPGGTWPLLLSSSLPEYGTSVCTVSVASAADDTLADTLWLFTTDIPFVSGIRIRQDTLAGTVRLDWDRSPHINILDYAVYKSECGDVAFPSDPSFVTTDTFFTDSIIIALNPPAGSSVNDTADTSASTDSLVTTTGCFRYRVAIRTREQRCGPAAGYAEIDFADPASVATSIAITIPAKDSLQANNTATIGDTIVFLLTAENPTRALRSVAWYDPLADDTITVKPVTDTLLKDISDTLLYTFDTIGTRQLIGIVTDDAGTVRDDTVSIDIIQDVPAAYAGCDTGVFAGTNISLHGSGTDKFGSITGWEWKIGDDDRVRTSGPDTEFIAPAAVDTLLCSLTVTDDDGNRDSDEVRIFITKRIVRVISNVYHNLLLKEDGTLWANGSNEYGQLGDGSMEYRDEPVFIMNDVRTMAAGIYHSLILKNDGTLWGCGDNFNDQLGDGINLPHPFPVLLMTGIKAVAAGSMHSMFLKNDGSLWACGENENGQLGDGTTEHRAAAVHIADSVLSTATGEAHSIILKTDGSVWTCGSNLSGQLGRDSVLLRSSPSFNQIMTGAKAVYAGFNYSMILKDDHSLWACGTNTYGQLGDNTMEDRYAPVKVNTDVSGVVPGTGYSLTIKQDSTLWACGWNYYGSWGNNTWEDRYKPSRVTSDVVGASASLLVSLILKSDGSVWLYGAHMTDPTRVIPYLYNEEDDE